MAAMDHLTAGASPVEGYRLCTCTCTGFYHFYGNPEAHLVVAGEELSSARSAYASCTQGGLPEVERLCAQGKVVALSPDISMVDEELDRLATLLSSEQAYVISDRGDLRTEQAVMQSLKGTCNTRMPNHIFAQKLERCGAFAQIFRNFSLVINGIKSERHLQLALRELQDLVLLRAPHALLKLGNMTFSLVNYQCKLPRR